MLETDVEMDDKVMTALYTQLFDDVRKNHRFVQTAKMNDLNPEAYLRDTLTKIAEGHPIGRIEEPMPWRFESPITEAARG